MTLGRLLRTLRGERSASDVAKRVGVTRKALHLWESPSENPANRRMPSPEHLQRLLDHYGASVDDRLAAWALRAAFPAAPEGVEDEDTGDPDTAPTIEDEPLAAKGVA